MFIVLQSKNIMNCPKCKRQRTKISPDISGLRLVENAQVLVSHSVRNATNTMECKHGV